MENFPEKVEHPVKQLHDLKNLRQQKSELWNERAIQITIAESITAYLSTVDNAHTLRAKRNDLIQFQDCLENNGVLSLGDLGKLIGHELIALIEGFLDVRLLEGERKKTTIQRQKGTLRSWLIYLNEQFPELITTVPALRASRHKVVYSKGKTRSLSLEEWFRLKNEIENIWRDSKRLPGKKVKRTQWKQQKRLLALCYTGLLLGGRRISEILSLRWEDIDFMGNQVSINPLKMKEDETTYFLPLNEQLRQVLLQFKAEMQEEPLESDLVFDLSQQAVDQSLRRYGRQAEVGAVSFHVIRTSFITWSIERGDSMSEILNSTLHKTSQMIRYYDRSDTLKTSSILKFTAV